MHRLQKALLVLLALALMAPSEAFGASTISGVLKNDVNESLQGLTVQVFDATNAVLVAEGVTGADGSKGFSIAVRAGEYKLRFSGSVATKQYFQFYGTEGMDVFSLGTTLKVADNTNTVADAQLQSQFVPPAHCVPTDVALEAKIYDAQTEQLVQGIQISLVDPGNAVPLIKEAILTDENGIARFRAHSCSLAEAKVRISDPAGVYKPEFFGAGDRDSFEYGATLNLIPLATFKEGIAQATPADAIGNISQDIVNLGLDPSAQASLTNTLSTSVAILSDNNPNNDRAACGVLNGFKNQLNGKVNSGTLSPAQADILAASAEQVRSTLGCK